MTGSEFREARLRLGYSFREMAVACGLPPGSARLVRRWEQDGPTDQVAERVQALLAALEGEGSP